MKKIFYLAALFVSFLAIYSCSENPADVSAEKMTLQQLAMTPGYTWMNFEVDQYKPDNFIIDEIKNNFKSDEHSFIIFTKPSCSCPGKHKQTPEFVKCLNSANIPIEKCEFFSMGRLTNKHPFSELITLNELPTIIVMKNGLPVYSITDSINTINGQNPNNAITVEQAVLLGLQK